MSSWRLGEKEASNLLAMGYHRRAEARASEMMRALDAFQVQPNPRRPNGYDSPVEKCTAHESASSRTALPSPVRCSNGYRASDTKPAAGLRSQTS